jgi:hypothetical protein
MAELGSGNGSDYPASIDTNSSAESAVTTVRFDVPNDSATAIVAIQTELGTDPAGSKSNVKTYLQTEHGANGTHTAITATSLVVSAGSVAAPAIGWTDTGFYEPTANVIAVTLGGAQKFTWTVNSFASNNAAGPAIQNETATSTNPTLVPNRADVDTGVGWNTTDKLSLIAGGTECMNMTSTAITTTLSVATAAITADDLTVTAAAASPPDSNTLTKENIIKAWAHVTYSSGTPTLADNFNISGIVDVDVGDLTVQWDTDFANATYALGGMVLGETAFVTIESATGLTTADADVTIVDDTGTSIDPNPGAVTIIAIGDQ